MGDVGEQGEEEALWFEKEGRKGEVQRVHNLLVMLHCVTAVPEQGHDQINLRAVLLHDALYMENKIMQSHLRTCKCRHIEQAPHKINDTTDYMYTYIYLHVYAYIAAHQNTGHMWI